jgi:hypothetical protein
LSFRRQKTNKKNTRAEVEIIRDISPDWNS